MTPINFSGPVGTVPQPNTASLNKAVQHCQSYQTLEPVSSVQRRKYTVPGFDNACFLASSSLSVIKALELQCRLFSYSLTRAGVVCSLVSRSRRRDAAMHAYTRGGVLTIAIGSREIYSFQSAAPFSQERVRSQANRNKKKN